MRRWIDQLERVHRQLTGEDRVTSGLLARMLLVSIVLGGVLLTALILLFPDQFNVIDTQMILIGWLTLPVWFSLNRTGRLRSAYNAYVLMILIVFIVPNFTDGASASSLAFAAIGYLLAGIFFDSRRFVLTIAIASAWVGVMIVVNANNPDSPVWRSPINYIGIWFFLLLMGALVTTFVTHLRTVEAGRWRELELANAQLRESEHLLERRVEDRTRELVVAKEDADAARQEAERANMIKSQFLSSMSHELRTPLNSILNFGEFLNMGVLGDVTPDQQSALTSITDSGQHLLSLINDILDISKIQSGMLKLVVEQQIDLRKEIDSALVTARALLGDKPVPLHVEIAPDLPRIDADKRRVRQVLLNLLSNAVKFTDEGSVTFRAERRGDEVYLAVTDTGPGVEAADRERLFQPFEQTETGIKHTGGTGLGLAISKALVDAHGGWIGFDSTPGQGSTFEVRLPLHRPTEVSISSKG
ncbi:MAG: ATP-binding protein [Chloroflexota bacterium]|nr:ATP-binding protein [Chloroflexota bacterium]